jgi:phenylacetate-CoA ligase
MTLIARIREWQKEPELRRRLVEYSRQVSPEDRLRWQLERFNQVWQTVAVQVPYYADLIRQKNIPSRFESWEEFLACMPVSDRSTVRQNRHRMTDNTRRIDGWATSGGSTGELVRLPVWHSEEKFTDPDVWVARAWWGVRFSHRNFRIWGHGHLFNNRWVTLRHRLKERLIGIYFFPAYNLSDQRMRLAADRLLWYKPHHVRGFGMALDLFARVNQDRADEFRKLNLKVVAATGEAFPFDDSQSRISQVFHAPVALEYGSNEAHTIAHTSPGEDYRVFWQNYFLEAFEPGISGHGIVRITNLFPKCFPLIRYDLGDEIELDPQAQTAGYGLDRFARVLGRQDDYIELPDGTRINSIALKNVMSQFPEIMRYQMIQKGGEFNVYVITELAEIPEGMSTAIRARFARLHPDLANLVCVHKAVQLEQTIAGKTRIVIRKPQ